jgi:hypothetical protein
MTEKAGEKYSTAILSTKAFKHIFKHTIVLVMAELSWLTLSIGRSGLLGYNNGANTTGTSSRGKSRRRLFKNVSFVSATIPEKKRKKNYVFLYI